MKTEICVINGSEELVNAAAEILFTTFKGSGKHAWLPTMGSAIKEVKECVAEGNICIGISINGSLAGWAGLRPMYARTWELHPIVIKKECQNRGLGKELLGALEDRARKKGIIGIVLGTDDETNSTSLSQGEINGNNIYEKMAAVKNLKRHPFEFYEKCGYIIVGVIPNANGRNKPDIWMWKDLGQNP